MRKVRADNWQEANGNLGAGGSTPDFTVDTVTPIAETDCEAGHIGLELRYPLGSKSAGVYAIISRGLAETAQQRRLALELLGVEYAAAAMT